MSAVSEEEKCRRAARGRCAAEHWDSMQLLLIGHCFFRSLNPCFDFLVFKALLLFAADAALNIAMHFGFPIFNTHGI